MLEVNKLLKKLLQYMMPITCVIFIALGISGASAQTFSNETTWDDGTNFYYKASYSGSYTHFNVLLDTDNNASTGYSINNIGADYMIQDTYVYKSTVNGGWGWSQVSSTASETYPSSGTVQFSIPLSLIGSPSSAKIALQGGDANWNMTTDPNVVTYTKSTGTTFSNETAWNDSTNFYYQANYTGSWSHFEVFLDTDNSASTGYSINTIGADYLLEDTAAYKSTANGNSWSWSSSIGTVTLTVGSGTVKMAVPLSAIGSPASAKVAFQVLTSSWTPTVDPHVVTFTKTGSVPPVPTGLTAAAGNGQVSLNWSASSGATSYNVYRGTSSGGESSTPVATGVTTTSYTNTGLSNGVTYYFKVAAVNSSGTSGQSNEAGATPSTGAAYYVSPNGSDSNPGTLSSPWLTPQHAANVVGPGSTVYLEAGTYAPFQVNVSGSASGGYITFTNYNGQNAVIDGSGFTGSYDQGLVNIVDQSYVVIKGLEIRNGSSSTTSFSPCGVCVKTYAGGLSNIQILNNNIHNIATTASSNGDAHGILVRGENSSTAMTNITVSGNQIYNCTLGWSESLTMAGNLNTFTVSNNTVHDNNNIGIDAEGGYSSIANGAQANNGTIKGNTVYNCSTLHNPYYNSNTCAGLYDDGAVNIVFDGNVSHNNDYGCEIASENSGVNANNVTVRNNLMYNNAAYGLGVGGYKSSGVGGTTNCTFVNNTLYNDDTNNWWIGEIHIGWSASGNKFDNNIIYAGSSNDVMVKDEGTDGASVGTFDYNDYFSTNGNANAKWQWINQTSWTSSLSSWQSMSGQDAHSFFGDPLFVSTSTPDFDIKSGSPALNSGNYGLGSSIYGSTDFAGNSRTKNGAIDIGAYED